MGSQPTAGRRLWPSYPDNAAETHQGATCGFAAIRLGQDAKPGDVFVVERQLPEAAGLLQYEIKSEKDGHARVVRENQISDL